MWPWDVLGLTPTGDERLIRKAYAERARQHRPDDDPDGFIRLRAAYEAALAAARIAATEDGDGKVVRLDGFRGRPIELDDEKERHEDEPRPEAPRVELVRIEPPPVVERQSLPEPPVREPVLPRNARLRIERVGDGETETPKPPRPPIAEKPKVRIERVSPEVAAAARPSVPPVKSKIRIERIVPDGERTPDPEKPLSPETETCPPGKS